MKFIYLFMLRLPFETYSSPCCFNIQMLYDSTELCDTVRRMVAAKIPTYMLPCMVRLL